MNRGLKTHDDFLVLFFFLVWETNLLSKTVQEDRGEKFHCPLNVVKAISWGLLFRSNILSKI